LLFVDPEHADERQQNAHSEHAIFVVSDIDAGLDEEQGEGNLARHHQVLVEVDVPFFTPHVEGIEFVTILVVDSLVRREERRRANRRKSHAEGVVHLVRDPGVDRWERHVDCYEVQETHDVPAIVFVLKRLVD